ncbi:MAG TPA: DUF3846 domain-containing protein [Candidatus Saccharimonadales bacterium]|nr:DUF3846 domain-containing protein [Candidatus Saccharimonadales bacterium]
MKNFVIKTEKGFHKDFIAGTFVEDIDAAHKFEDFTEASLVKTALEAMDGIKEAVILENDPKMEKLLEMAKQYLKDAEINTAANPTSQEIQVVIIEPGEKPYKKTIANNLEAFREIVGGYIENLFIGRTAKDARIGIVLNEEGKLIDLPFNKKIITSGNVSDWLAGTIFITAYNMEGDNVSLNDDECEHFIKKFSSTEVYL